MPSCRWLTNSGATVLSGDNLMKLVWTPQPYLDNQQTDNTFPTLEEKVTPEAGDEYIQASIIIPHGNTFAHRTIVSCKCNAEGNIIGCAHDNPILNSCVYDIEFSDSKVTTLDANAIAKAVYTLCDPDGNEYIVLDELIDINHTDYALKLDQQKIMANSATCQWKSTKG